MNADIDRSLDVLWGERKGRSDDDVLCLDLGDAGSKRKQQNEREQINLMPDCLSGHFRHLRSGYCQVENPAFKDIELGFFLDIFNWRTLYYMCSTADFEFIGEVGPPGREQILMGIGLR